MKRTMDRAARLREAAKRLRGEAREAKTRFDRDVRAEAAERLDEQAHEHDMAQARWEASEHPAVLEHQRRRIGNTVAEQEIRAALRKEVPEPAPASPALQALARAADPEAVRREMAWQDTDGPTEGWLNA